MKNVLALFMLNSKPFSRSAQLSTKFKLRINVEIVESKKLSCLHDKSKLFILLINVKMSISVG